MKTYEECITERNYILSINPVNPGETFNNDPQCFANYCNMQADIIGQRFPLMAHEIRQARDIAEPGFRSRVRQEGGRVDGILAYR
jgi:hypothetical protein